MGSAVPHTQQVIKDNSRVVGFGPVEREARQIQLAQGGACGFGLRQAFRRSTRLAAEVDQEADHDGAFVAKLENAFAAALDLAGDGRMAAGDQPLAVYGEGHAVVADEPGKKPAAACLGHKSERERGSCPMPEGPRMRMPASPITSAVA